MNCPQCAEVGCWLEVACEMEEVFIGMLKWQMTRQKFRKVILYVKACRSRRRREEVVPGGLAETQPALLLKYCREVFKEKLQRGF